MKSRKVPFALLLLFAVTTTLWACNRQPQKDPAKAPFESTADSETRAVLDSNAMVIFLDQEENLWFASEEKGIYRYDGTKLVLFTSADGLDSYRILSVQEDEQGSLFLDTPEGVFQYEEDQFTQLPVANEGAPLKKWNSEPGDLWFRMGWDQKGPYRYDGESLYHLEFPKNRMEEEFYRQYPQASINPYAIYSLYEDRKGNVWFGTSNLGVYVFDGKELSWMYESHLLETPGGGNFGVRSVVEDQAGDYWICHARYKYRLTPNASAGQRLRSLSYHRETGIENIGTENLYFYSMETDEEGNVWMFAKEEGLWLNDGKNLRRFFVEDGEKRLSPTWMYKDREGTFWLGTKGFGIFRYREGGFEKFVIQ